jgi:hypothetical protein
MLVYQRVNHNFLMVFLWVSVMAFHRKKQSQATGVDIGTRFHRRREIDVDPCGPRNVKKTTATERKKVERHRKKSLDER